MSLLYYSRKLSVFILLMTFNISSVFSEEGFMDRDSEALWRNGKPIGSNWWVLIVIGLIVLLIRGYRAGVKEYKTKDSEEAKLTKGNYVRFLVLKDEDDLYGISARGSSFDEAYSKDNLQLYKSSRYKFIMYKVYNESEYEFSPKLKYLGLLDSDRYKYLKKFKDWGFEYIEGNIYYDRYMKEENMKRHDEFWKEVAVKRELDSKIYKEASDKAFEELKKIVNRRKGI